MLVLVLALVQVLAQVLVLVLGAGLGAGAGAGAGAGCWVLVLARALVLAWVLVLVRALVLARCWCWLGLVQALAWVPVPAQVPMPCRSELRSRNFRRRHRTPLGLDCQAPQQRRTSSAPLIAWSSFCGPTGLVASAASAHGFVPRRQRTSGKGCGCNRAWTSPGTLSASPGSARPRGAHTFGWQMTRWSSYGEYKTFRIRWATSSHLPIERFCLSLSVATGCACAKLSSINTMRRRRRTARRTMPARPEF